MGLPFPSSWATCEGSSGCCVHDTVERGSPVHPVPTPLLTDSVCLCVTKILESGSCPWSPSWLGSRNLTVKKKSHVHSATSLQEKSHAWLLSCSKSWWALTIAAKPWQMFCGDSVWKSHVIKLIPTVVIQLMLCYGTKKHSYCSFLQVLDRNLGAALSRAGKPAPPSASALREEALLHH